MKRVLPCVAALAGCVVGGGPVLGYGKRGWFAGGEISGGGEVVLPQATLGYQSDERLMYVRVDEAFDGTAGQRPSDNRGIDDGTVVPGGRIGGGIGLAFANDNVIAHGVFTVAASAGHAFGPLTAGPNGNGCGVANTVGVLELQLRYADSWAVALAPRIERGTTFCN